MADPIKTIDLVLQQEDATLSGIVTNTPADRGGRTRFGLTEKWHPDLAAAAFFTAPKNVALAMAEKAYVTEYVPHLCIAAVKSDAVAFALLSCAVVEGAGKAVLLMQKTLNQLGQPINRDGSVGPKSLAALNVCDPGKLVRAYVAVQQRYFEAIVAADPTQQMWLHGWMNRAAALLRYAERVQQ